MDEPKSIELEELIDQLEKDLGDYINNSSNYKNERLAKFSVYAINIAISLSKLLNHYGRSIGPAEKYWFEGGRFHSDTFGPNSPIYANYCKLVDMLKEGNNI